MNQIIITNAHPHGFCFACDVESRDQVFIPVHIAEGHNLKPGDYIDAVLVPNYQDKSDRGTPWQAVKLHRDSALEVPNNQVCEEVLLDKLQTLNQEELDVEVLRLIMSGGYHTTAEISDYVDVDHKTVGNSAMRHFSAGRISKAEVFNRVGQQRPTMILWAASAKSFIEVV